jgi:hypothetical protein
MRAVPRDHRREQADHRLPKIAAVEGDIVATRVARHYAIGRVMADAKTQAYIEPHRALAATLMRGLRPCRLRPSRVPRGG